VEELYGNVANKIIELQSGDATEIQLVVVDTMFKTQDFSSGGSSDTFDDIGAVPIQHCDFALV
jgi:hypothetical protein